MRIAATILAGSILLAAASTASAQMSPPFETGKMFPIIKLPGADGEGMQSIAHFRGRKIVLHMFASW